MKALITGINGMVGSHLAEYLLKNTDWEVHGLIRWHSNLDNLTAIQDDITLHVGDLLDAPSLVDPTDDCDYIFHLAAHSDVASSYKTPLETYQTNTIGTENLLRVAEGKSIVHICSTSEVYGQVHRNDTPIKETCTLNPVSPYAISKAAADYTAQMYHKAYGRKILITRLFTHTGPRRGTSFCLGSFAAQIVQIERNMTEPLIWVGNLSSVRTWMDVRDAVRAYHLLVTHNPQFGEVYNIGGDYTCTVDEALKKLIKLSENPYIQIRTDLARLRPLDVTLQIPDSSKFRKHTNWKQHISFEQTLRDLLDYWRNK